MATEMRWIGAYTPIQFCNGLAGMLGDACIGVLLLVWEFLLIYLFFLVLMFIVIFCACDRFIFWPRKMF